MSIVKGSKKGSGQARQPNIAPDSAQSKTRINILYGLAEGEIEGLANGNKSILLENTPLEDNNGKLNFESVKVDFRSGTNDQDYIEGFPAVESETAIGVELKAGTPWAKSFKNLDLDALRIRLKWGPLRTQDATSGDVSGVTIEYAVELQTDGGPWTEVLKTKISDKTSANYERAHRINLPKADSDWLIRVRRITPNSTSEYVSDKMYIEAVTEVIDAKLRYPNTALLGLQYDAETFNNVAKIAVECKGTKIKLPSNYNPVSRTYAGMWDGTFISAYSNNPAWVYYDICTSDRYGLGDRLTPFMIDKWSLYRLGQYCDESVNDGQGGQEPRFTCNVYLQRAEEAYEILKKLAGVFRAISYWDGNSIICDADIPQDTYFTYTRANVIGEFEYSGTRARDRHNVVKVAFDNPANHYKTEYEYVRDEQAISDSGQVRILDLNAWGCTSRGQAQRAGLWALKSEQSETRTVTFKVGLDGWIPQPGRVIEIADELFAGRANGGRVSTISEDRVNLTIDRDDVIAKPGDRLVVNGENGKAQTRVIQSINGRVITVTLPFDLGSIAAENIWVIDAQDLATMKFRVISIRQEEKNKFTINAIQYNSKKFDQIDNGAYFEEVPISVINPTIQDPVSDILITSENKVNQGINITTMILSWKQAKGAVKYLVEWRKDNGSWLRLPLTGNNSLEVQGVYSGNYQARVTAISAFEVSSLPVYSPITELVGKKGVPPKLEFIRATGILFGMQLNWSFPNVGAQDAAYVEIRVSPDGVSNIALLGQFAYPTNTHKVQGLQPNLIQYYSGRIVDKIGNVGAWSEWVNGTTTADPEAVLDLISGHIAETDLAQELQGKIENTVNVAEAAEQAATSAQTAATNAQTAAGEAKTAATNAQSAATSAQAQASTAQQVANDASAIAANAKNTADQAAASAMTANTAASEAKTTAANASTAATNAQTTANNAAAAASKVASDLTTSTNQLNQKIADESSTRTAAISKLNDGLTTETTQRKSEDAALLSNIETYKSSTNGTLSSLQTQITTNATNTSANTSKITSLDSRLTTNEGKTAEAISAAATAQQTANTAVTNAASAASAVTALKAELSSGKGINNIIAPFSDPQELPILGGAGRTVTLADSLLRRNGKAYKVSHTAAAHYVYFGTAQAAQAPSLIATHIEAGRSYMFSVWIKALSTAIPSFRFNIMWFLRNPSTGEITTGAALIFPQGQTDSYIAPNANGQRYSFKAVTAPANAIGATIYAVGNPSGPTASEYLVDMLMLEESLGSEKPASTWVAGPADLSAIKNAFDANATAINNLTTRVANDEGIITSQGNSITQLNNSVTSINGTLSTKADSTALNALTNRVSTAEGQITAQGSAIVSLKNDLVATNNALTTKADTSALNSLDSKVSNIDGRVTSNTNAVTSLQGRITTVESGLSTKADASALSNYYTKTEADSATSGAINTFNSQLTIGGVNAVANSEAPRTSTAATNKEYLLYERSAELKAFYDENLDKPITISFEMSVPVVGPVQVYSSNSSAHTFAVSVNAVIPNQFIKYSVTVNPKTHTASTTVSTIEFYGVYGTGRIPTIRKLQIEAGTKATAWSPSPRDTKALIDANATAIQTTQTKVDNIDGRLTAATESITSLGSRMTTAEGNITGTNNAVNGLSTRMATAEGKITNQSDSITSLQNSVASINGTLANKADSSAVTNLTSRVTAAEGNITSQSGQITTLNNSLTTTNNTLNDVNALARLLSLGKPLRDDPTFKTTSSGGLSAYVFPAGTSWVKQAKSTDNPTDSTSEMLIRATQALGGGWYPTVPTLVLTPNKTFLIKQIIKMPVGTKLLAVGNTTGTGGYIRILGNDLGTGKFETYYTVIQGGPDAANTIQGHNRVVNGTNPPVPSTANPVDAILASYEVFDVTAVNDTIPKAYSDSIAANASAITNLSNTVTQQGNTITSHSNSITTLNNSITSINGSLANKAESSALQSLDSKVTTIDGKVTSNTSALTALQSSFDGLPNQGVNLLGPEISNPVEKPTNWVSGLPYEVVSSNDTINVRAFQFTMPAANGSGMYFNIGGGQVPRQWLTEGKYIFSFVAKTVDGTPPHPIDWLMYNVSATRLRFNITATLTRYSGVFTVPAGGAAACMLLIGNPTAKAAGQVVVIERMMLERQVGSNTTPSTWIAGSDPSGMIISTQAKATDLFNTATNQNSATAGRVTSLESRMTSTEGALSTKADASALQTLDTKVTNVDGKATSNTNAITSLSSTLSNATSSISMNAGNSFTDWTVKDGYGEYSVVAQADGQAGRVIQLGNNSGNDMIWLHPNNFIPFDSAKTYRLRARYRRRAGTGTVYIGIAQKTPDKALYVTTSNTLTSDMNSSNYIASAQSPTADQWQEVVAYIKGRAAGAATGSGSQASPRTVAQQAGFITPMFLANYANQSGTVELDYLILEDAEAVAGNQATATALTALDTKVTEVDGRLTTATNSITALSSRMSTAEGNIASNASAIANTYTKTQTDSAIAGEVNSFKASLQVAGTNLLRNGNFSDDLTSWATWGGTSVVRTIESINGKNWLHLVANNTSVFRGISQSTSANAFKRNTEYTISFNAYSTNSTGGVSIVIHQSGGGNNDPQITPTVAITNKNARYSVTFKSADLDTKSAFNFMIGPQNSVVGDIYITDIMFSEGNVSSGWMPSNDQIMGNISANANAVSSLTSRVATAEGTISSQGSSITSLTNNLALTTTTANAALPKIQGGTGAAKLFRGALVWQQNGANLTGNIVIQTPITFTAKMFRLALTGYNYLSGKNEINLNIGGHAYSGTSIMQHGVVNSGTLPIRVRLGVLNGTVVVILTSQAPGAYWQYPKFNIDAEIGYTTPPDEWINGWSASFIAETDLASSGITAIIEPSLLDVSTEITANASAISNLTNTVTQQGNTITSHSNSITSLNNSITSINSSLTSKADAAALTSLSNRVTTAEGTITNQGNSITSLTNSLAVSGKGGTNLLIKSNVVGTYNGVAYPHLVYEMGEEWEVGAKYTLIWCAEHARGTGDGSSYLSVYAGGGSQSLQSLVNTGGKVVNKTTFTKSTAGTGKVINFYMINRPTADKNSIGTVYWAVLVKGDVITTDAWIPSSYDYLPDTNANATAITNLTNTVSQQGSTITSHSNSITSLNNSITSINGALNTKANTSAVTDLDSRVTTAEGKITANTSSITSLTANLKNVANGITMSASLDVDPDSEWIYWTKNGEVARADDTSALGGKVYRFGNNAGNDHVNARSKAKLPFDQTKTYRIRARYRRLSGTGTIYCAVCTLAADGTSHVNSSNTVSTDFGSSNYFVINQSPANNVWQEVTVYVKGRAAGAATGSWTLAVPRQMPNATAFLSVQFLANYSNAAGMTELDYLIIEDADAIAANDATANALSSLDTRVTTAEGKITSQGSSITSLNNSITTINGTLSSKADSSALTNLANRVTVTEGSITSQGSSITSLNSSVNGLLKDIEVTDTRSTNQPPSWYWTNYPKRIVREFKQASTIGLTGMGTYVSLETYVYYSDATGGAIIQIARGSDSKLTAERRSASTSTWGAWSQDIKTLSDGLANKAEASALSTLDAKVSTIDGKVSTQATSITNLTTTVGGHTASIQSQQESIDGLKARATLKLQSGNLVGGVGIENDSKTVDFIIQANRFAIGAPSTVTGTVTPKYAFSYQSTSTTLPNGTVIPAGLYLDNASIGYINAEKINASSLSALSANLGTLTTLKDPAKPNGARMVLTGSLVTVYDDNNVIRVRLGLWD